MRVAAGQLGPLPEAVIKCPDWLWLHGRRFPNVKAMAYSYKRLVTDWVDAINSRDVDRLAGCWASGAVVHALGVRGDLDLAALRADVERFWAAMPDLRVEIHELIAEGDRVAARLTSAGTFTGEFMGKLGGGNKVSFPGFAIYRCTDEGIAEEWVLDDLLTFLIQIEAVPPSEILTAGLGSAS